MIALAFLGDLLIQDPQSKYHPIALMGLLIIKVENMIYRDSKVSGFLLLVIVQAIVAILSLTIEHYFFQVFQVALIYFGLSSASLRVALRTIRLPLENNQLAEARENLQMIVTRKTGKMNECEVILSTLESGAENFADGIVGPYFYLLVGLIMGHPIMFLYFFKMASTLDSMVGYKNDKYHNFGYFSAKLDDVLMYIPSRLAIVFLVCGAWILRLNNNEGFKILKRDSNKAHSPNSGITESFVAGLLGIQFGGPVNYGGRLTENPRIGDKRKPIHFTMIETMEKLIFIATLVLIGGMTIGNFFI